MGRVQSGFVKNCAITLTLSDREKSLQLLQTL